MLLFSSPDVFQARPGETILVHGASGAVGNAAVQIARAIGAVVVGTAGTKDGMDVVTDCGAHHVFNHNHKSYEKKMVEHIGGVGFDVIIEHLANINLGHDVQMVKEGARIMVVGCRQGIFDMDIDSECTCVYFLVND